MAPKIGSHTMISVRGVVHRLAKHIEVIEYPGVDGADFRDQGDRAPDTTLESVVDVSSSGGVPSTLDNYRDDIGSTVTVEDDFGRSLSNVMILDVRLTRTEPVGRAVGGTQTNPAALMYCTWTVRATT